MKNSDPTAIIGGYDAIAKSFFSETRLLNKESIFINLNNKKTTNQRVFNCEIFQLKKIITLLKKYKIKNLLFLGKISRPNLSNFKNDGEIDKYIPQLVNSFKEGDGKILSNVINIFKKKGFNILSPKNISKSFFLNKKNFNQLTSDYDKLDITKSIKLLNDLSKYDNAQSIVCVNGYIIAIEAVEGTDQLLSRVYTVRKKLNQIGFKAGVLTKIPKKNQSKLVDLPVIGLKTLKLIKKANLNAIAIRPSLTLVHNKGKFLDYARKNNLKIYKI